MDLPNNVWDRVVLFSDPRTQARLALVDGYLRNHIYTRLYRNIMIVDADVVPMPNGLWTVLRKQDLGAFVSCLNVLTFVYIDKVLINTHSADHADLVLALYHKMRLLWAQCRHVVDFVNLDVQTLRTIGSLNRFLVSENPLLQNDDDDEACRLIVANDPKSYLHKSLKTWFFTDMAQLLAAAPNSNLHRLHIYVENNSYMGTPSLTPTATAAKHMAQISELFIHSPLALLQVSQVLGATSWPPLRLRRLSLASTHRVRNNAMLDFQHMNRLFDLNNLEELELKLSCGWQRECQDSCMEVFFDQWARHNRQHGVQAKIHKFALVHYKSLNETKQFKHIVEKHVFSGLLPNLREAYINLSNGVRCPEHSIDMKTVLLNFVHVPDLEVLHMSSFMCEWVKPLTRVFDGTSPHGILVNRCSCKECQHTRSGFKELALLDKCNNYSHKMDLSSFGACAADCVDFSQVENIKFLQYLAMLLRHKELVMERNLCSTGTMLDMADMPSVHTPTERFELLFRHSCLDELYQQMSARLDNLRYVNFGGIVMR